jgi:hypothetical protein
MSRPFKSRSTILLRAAGIAGSSEEKEVATRRKKKTPMSKGKRAALRIVDPGAAKPQPKETKTYY